MVPGNSIVFVTDHTIVTGHVIFRRDTVTVVTFVEPVFV